MMQNHQNEEVQTIHILGFSEGKLDHDVARLSKQKAEFMKVADHSSHHMHAHPLVAKVDGNKIVEFNIREEVPKDWIINPENGAVDTALLPERLFPTPHRDNGINIDEQSLEHLCHDIGLDTAQIERELKLHKAHQIVHEAQLVAATENCLVLRGRDGDLRQGAQKYTLPPLEKGHVPIPTP